VDILRSVSVQIRISETGVEVSSPRRSWRLDDANRIVLGLDGRERRVIQGIGTPGGFGDRTDAAVSVKGSQVLRAFDIVTFDPDVSSAATRYWSFQGLTAGARHPTLAFMFMRPVLQLFWPAWDAIPFDARRSYLNVVSRWADVVVNGQPSASWRLFRRLIRRPPQISE
jgi:hypothetical protein